ncbi:hypothetical protein HDV00_006805 [Rhizophlyctis rosea]|nr:hypothetical protein HDV00_006805 [Rhizophlyctis rosea]
MSTSTVIPTLKAVSTLVENDLSDQEEESGATVFAPWGQLESENLELASSVVLDGRRNELWFGRGQDCPEETRINNPRVSTLHCKVYREGGIPYILDTSRNGTYVNGEVVGKNVSRRLNDGDSITFHSKNDHLPSYTFHDQTNAADKKPEASSGETPTRKRTASDLQEKKV